MKKLTVILVLPFLTTACAAWPIVIPSATPPPAATFTPAIPPATPAPSATATTLSADTSPTADIQLQYAVIQVAENHTLNIRKTAGEGGLVLETIPYNRIGITLTGAEMKVDDDPWVEVRLPNGLIGWVSANHLAEYIAPEVFCADTRIATLVEGLKSALQSQNSNFFASLVSPMHGMSLRYLRDGHIVNYTPAEAITIFDSKLMINWGVDPVSGQIVQATFYREVLPALLDVFDGNYTANCNTIAIGEASFTYSWPSEYTNINYYTYYRPPGEGDELNWSAWVIGFDYVNGQPYLFAMQHLNWEP